MQRNFSSSKHWLGTWGLLFLALITTVLGFFTLPAGIATGGGLLLLGASVAALMIWTLWKKQDKRSTQQRWVAGMTVAVGSILGFFLIAAGEKDSLVPVQAVDEEKSESLPPSVTSTLPSSSLPTSSTPPAPPTVTVTSTMQMEPEAVTVISTFFMAPEEVTTTATVYIPAPPQTFQPPIAPTLTEPSSTETVETPEQQSEGAAAAAEDVLGMN